MSKQLTPKEIRDYNTAEALAFKIKGTAHEHYLEEYEIVYLTDEKVRVGPIEVLEGHDPNKPVIRTADTKRTLPGSGRMKRKPKPDPSLLPATAPADYRNSVSYREAFEALLPADADASVRGSLAWWFDQAWQAAEGSPQMVECPHPELHREGSRTQPIKHLIAFKKEANLIFKMVELAVGKAQATINVNTNERKLIESLEHRVVEVRLQGFDSVDADSRIKMIESYGYDTHEVGNVGEGTTEEDEIDGVYIEVEVLPEQVTS